MSRPDSRPRRPEEEPRRAEDRPQPRPGGLASGRPLWRLALAVLLVAFSTRSGALAVMLYLDGGGQLALLLAYALQTAAGLAAAAGIFLGQRWAPEALLVLCGAVVAITAYEGFVLGLRPPVAAFGQILVIGLALLALAWFVRRDLRGGS